MERIVVFRGRLRWEVLLRVRSAELPFGGLLDDVLHCHCGTHKAMGGFDLPPILRIRERVREVADGATKVLRRGLLLPLVPFITVVGFEYFVGAFQS